MRNMRLISNGVPVPVNRNDSLLIRSGTCLGRIKFFMDIMCYDRIIETNIHYLDEEDHHLKNRIITVQDVQITVNGVRYLDVVRDFNR